MKCDKCGYEPMSVEEIENLITDYTKMWSINERLLTNTNRGKLAKALCEKIGAGKEAK